MDWSREIQRVNDPDVLKISDAWKKAHSSIRLLSLTCIISSLQSKDVGRIDLARKEMLELVSQTD